MSRRHLIPDDLDENLITNSDYDSYYTDLGWTKVVVRDVATGLLDQASYSTGFRTYTSASVWLDNNTTRGWDMVYCLEEQKLLVLYIEDKCDALTVKLKWP